MTWTFAITSLFKVFGFLLNIFGAGQKQKQKFLELVEAAKDEGKITVAAFDTFKAQHEAIIAKIEADKKKAEELEDVNDETH